MIREYHYYYDRDVKRRPIKTHCIIISEEGFIAKGTAICSKKDQPYKNLGKLIAFQRAVAALASGSSKYDEKKKFYKYIFDPELNEREKRIVRIQ